ncbi:MAG: hypothetical protein WBM44_16640, partial [Waterburya sp.]
KQRKAKKLMITSKINHVVIRKLMMKQENIRAILPSPEDKHRTGLIHLTAKLVSKILEQQTQQHQQQQQQQHQETTDEQ